MEEEKVKLEIDGLVKKAKKAEKDYEALDQQKIDEMCSPIIYKKEKKKNKKIVVPERIMIQ